MSKIALITGATAGIGEASAFALAEKGFDLIITGRRADRLKGLEDVLKKAYPSIKILDLCFDVRNNAEVEQAIGSLSAEWKVIDVLLNNAGLAVGLNHIQDGVVDDWERMIDTNMKGLLYVTRQVAPLMIQRGSGHIVNIGSIASKEVYENGNVYCATKHAVDALTKAMRLDMLQHGIKVSLVCPGMADTEFSSVRFKGDDERAKNVYKGFEPLHANDIADVIAYVVTLPPYVNINDLLIMPTAQASALHVKRD